MKSSSNTVNASQLQVDGHRVDHVHPQPDPQMCIIYAAGRSKDPDSLVLENHDEFYGSKKFPSIILVLKNYLTIIQRLSTHAF
jgi:hypothetical protein